MSTNFSRTILGPLTTTYTQAPSCSVLVAPYCPGTTCNVAWQAQDCSPVGDATDHVEDATSCWPPVTSEAIIPAPPFNGWGFYSPATLCPSGWSSACTALAGGFSQWPVQFSMVEGETAIGCCPSGYTCTNGGHQTCELQATAPDTWPVVTCEAGTSGGYTLNSLPITATETYTTSSDTSSSYTVTATTTIETYFLYAPMVQINWKSSDLAASTPTTTRKSNTAVQVSQTASASPTPAPSSGLSTGAKVAIGVVIPLVVIAALIFAFFVLRRRRRSTSNERHETIPRPHPHNAELPNTADPYYDDDKKKPNPAYMHEMSEMRDGHPSTVGELRGSDPELVRPTYEMDAGADNQPRTRPGKLRP